MVKEGPCRHCGVTSTPLWRNGPPEKPILCNACGSRWRTKGNLTNYTPLHARLEADNCEEYKVSNIRRKEVKAPKRKKSRNNDVVGLGGDVYNYSHSYQKFMDDDSSYRSSSGSDESNSESLGPFSSTIGSDLSGPEHSFVRDTTMPSRKRTCNRSKPSPIEKLTHDLYTILQEQRSYCSESLEEELLYESDTPMFSVEIGHGSVLIRHPSEIAHEEESEASCLSAEIKTYPMSEAHLRPVCRFVHAESKGAIFQPPRTEKSKKISGQQTMNLAQSYMSESANVHDIQHLLGRRDSPLCAIDLNGIVNLKEFAAQFTTREQQQLLKYLPKSDIENYPSSLKHLFNDPLFRESSLCFQQLLSEGVFDLSFPNAKPDDCRNLRRQALCNLFKAHWVEQYDRLKKSHNPIVERTIPESEVMEVAQLAQKPQTSDTKILPKDPISNQTKEFVATGFPPSGLSSSLISHPLGYDEVHNDQDLLLDVKSNYAFPQAELLPQSQCG